MQDDKGSNEFGLNFTGTIFGQSGYDAHCRGLVNALYKCIPNIHLECTRPQDWARRVNDNELKMLDTPFNEDWHSVMVGLPPFYRLELANKCKSFSGFAVWEGTRVPVQWINYLLDGRIENIFVPSKHVKDAILTTASETYGYQTGGFMGDFESIIKIVPHGFDPEMFKPMKTDRSDKFTFVANKGWAEGINDRGGIQWLLKAFTDEFSDEDDVELIIRLNTIYNPNMNLDEEIKKLKLRVGKKKMIKLITEPYTQDKIAKIYNMGDVFVSPTMGDAFNLPCIEAMACGKPVITTGFGGQTDYVNNENGWLCDYKLIDVTHSLMYEGNQWAMPDLKHLRKLMRNCLTNQDEVEKKGAKALETSRSFTWENSAKTLLKYIN